MAKRKRDARKQFKAPPLKRRHLIEKPKEETKKKRKKNWNEQSDVIKCKLMDAMLLKRNADLLGDDNGNYDYEDDGGDGEKKDMDSDSSKKEDLKKFSGFSPSDRILLVGEGNFSFSRALVRILGTGYNLIATTFDSHYVTMQKHPDAGQILEELNASGANVKFEVDATRLQQCLTIGKKRRKNGEICPLSEPFDRIVFNFPHVGLGIKDEQKNIQKNKTLIWEFFLSSLPLLSPLGQIHVALKTMMPYIAWNITAVAHQTNALRLFQKRRFDPSVFPGYEHRRTIGFEKGVSAENNEEILGKSKTYVFVRK